jgi:P27 family predicted phage terminase small subunit
MPSDMDDASKKVWRHVMHEMGSSGVILAADTDVLRCYCEAVSLYVSVRKELAASTALIRGRDAGYVKNPLHQIVREQRDAVRAFARELGLSPAARANMQVQVGPAAGDIEDVLGPSPRALRVVGGGDA